MPKAPDLRAGRYLLRAWTPADVDFAVSAALDPEIARFSSVGTAITADSADSWIRQRDDHDRLDWAIESAGMHLGRVSLANIDATDQVAEVGYWVLARYRHQGITKSCLHAVEQLAFGELHLFRLVIRHEPDNLASCAVAKSRGYVAEGTQRGAFTRDGVRRDLHAHALLATDERRAPH